MEEVGNPIPQDLLRRNDPPCIIKYDKTWPIPTTHRNSVSLREWFLLTLVPVVLRHTRFLLHFVCDVLAILYLEKRNLKSENLSISYTNFIERNTSHSGTKVLNTFFQGVAPKRGSVSTENFSKKGGLYLPGQTPRRRIRA